MYIYGIQYLSFLIRWLKIIKITVDKTKLVNIKPKIYPNPLRSEVETRAEGNKNTLIIPQPIFSVFVSSEGHATVSMSRSRINCKFSSEISLYISA